MSGLEEYAEGSVDALTKIMKKTFYPGDPGISNPSITFDFDIRHRESARQIVLLTEIYHQYLRTPPRESDFPDSYIQVRNNNYRRLSFKFRTPEMGLDYMKTLGPIINDIMTGKFHGVPDTQFKAFFEDRILYQEADFTPPEAIRPVNNSRPPDSPQASQR